MRSCFFSVEHISELSRELLINVCLNDKKKSNYILTLKKGSRCTNLNIKIRTFWEAHQIWKKNPLKIWHYWVTSKEYFPNLLESTFLCQNFVYWVLKGSTFWLGTCLFSDFGNLCKVWARLNKLDVWHFTKVRPKFNWGIIFKHFNVKFVQS